MANRSSDESKEHRDLITMMINYYQSNGYTNIKADLDGCSQPDQINGHIPDATVMKNNIQTILEAESCSTVDEPNMSLDELVRLVAQALYDTMKIDGDVGGQIKLAIIDENGMREIPKRDVDTYITKW